MISSGAVANGIGQPVRRKEDFRLLTGRGSFADDIRLSELAHAVILRSPHAHAHIRSIDKAATLASAGVLAVLAGRDYVADGLGPIPHGAGLMGQWPRGFEAPGRSRPAITRCRSFARTRSGRSFFPHYEPMIKSGSRAITSSAVTTRSSAAP
jgi:CO/xanthine dehydrogenase Mo-binding subunit